MRSHRTVHLVAVVALVALAVLAGGVAVACGSSTSASASAAADVEFIAVDDFDVADYAGKPLVVNYFGSWCPPCNLEAPELASWTESHPDAQFVGVAVEDTEDAAAGFMGKYGLSYPIVLDPDWSNANENGVTRGAGDGLLRREGQRSRPHHRRHHRGAARPELRQGRPVTRGAAGPAAVPRRRLRAPSLTSAS